MARSRAPSVTCSKTEMVCLKLNYTHLSSFTAMPQKRKASKAQIEILQTFHVGSTEVTFRASINLPSPSHQFPVISWPYPMFYHLPSTSTCHSRHSRQASLGHVITPPMFTVVSRPFMTYRQICLTIPSHKAMPTMAPNGSETLNSPIESEFLFFIFFFLCCPSGNLWDLIA